MILENNFVRPHHLGIMTNSIDTLSRWYRDEVGFEFSEEHIIPGDPELRLLFLKKGNLTLELIQKGSGEDFSGLAHGHWDHFALDCSDLKGLLARMRGRGITVADSDGDDPVVLADFLEEGVAYFTLQSPNGEKVEFNQTRGAKDPGDPQGRNWAHLGLPVTDLAASVAFYRELGFTENGRGGVDTPQGRVEARFMDLRRFTIELYQLAGADREEIRRRKDGFIDHICLEVVDIVEALERLVQAELIEPESRPVSITLSGTPYKNFFFTGPDEERIELWQRG